MTVATGIIGATAIAAMATIGARTGTTAANESGTRDWWRVAQRIGKTAARLAQDLDDPTRGGWAAGLTLDCAGALRGSRGAPWL